VNICIICKKECGNGGTELDGVRYPIHLDCYKNSNEEILRKTIEKNKEDN